MAASACLDTDSVLRRLDLAPTLPYSICAGCVDVVSGYVLADQSILQGVRPCMIHGLVWTMKHFLDHPQFIV